MTCCKSTTLRDGYNIVQEQLQAHLWTMQDHQDQVAALGDVVEVFCKVTANYAPGLFYT
jgi:hypothetical protein